MLKRIVLVLSVLLLSVGVRAQNTKNDGDNGPNFDDYLVFSATNQSTLPSNAPSPLDVLDGIGPESSSTIAPEETVPGGVSGNSGGGGIAPVNTGIESGGMSLAGGGVGSSSGSSGTPHMTPSAAWLGTRAFMNGIVPDVAGIAYKILFGMAGQAAGAVGDAADTIGQAKAWGNKPWVQKGKYYDTVYKNSDRYGDHFRDQLVKWAEGDSELKQPATAALNRWVNDGMEMRVSIIKNRKLVDAFNKIVSDTGRTKYAIDPELEELYTDPKLSQPLYYGR